MCSVSVVSWGRKFYVTSSLENVETRDISTVIMTGFLLSFYFFGQFFSVSEFFFDTRAFYNFAYLLGFWEYLCKRHAVCLSQISVLIFSESF